MSAVVESATTSVNHFDSADNITALSTLVALFIAKGDTRTATRILETLEKED